MTPAELVTHVAASLGLTGPTSTQNLHWIAVTAYHAHGIVVEVMMDETASAPMEVRVGSEPGRGWRVAVPVAHVDRAIACARILMGAAS